MAARFLANRLHAARYESLKRNACVAIRFDPVDVGRFVVYVDGDGTASCNLTSRVASTSRWGPRAGSATFLRPRRSAFCATSPIRTAAYADREFGSHPARVVEFPLVQSHRQRDERDGLSGRRWRSASSGARDGRDRTDAGAPLRRRQPHVARRMTVADRRSSPRLFLEHTSYSPGDSSSWPGRHARQREHGRAPAIDGPDESGCAPSCSSSARRERSSPAASIDAASSASVPEVRSRDRVRRPVCRRSHG